MEIKKWNQIKEKIDNKNVFIETYKGEYVTGLFSKNTEKVYFFHMPYLNQDSEDVDYKKIKYVRLLTEEDY